MNFEDLNEQFKNFTTTEWDNLPDIELYMDQVIAYLNKLLKPQLRGEDSSLITPSMINNYVKNGHIAPPEKKKYKKEQLAALYMICSIKQNLMINDAVVLLDTLIGAGSCESVYTRFIEMQQAAFTETSEKIAAFLSDGPKDDGTDASLAKLALLLTLQSTCNRIAAERIISALSEKKAASAKQQHKKE